jgi:deazaflavin-dependent oxidoreductase (nitroreductase family)
VGNRILKLLMRLGVSVWGSRTLEHVGRRSGEIHRTPVNPLMFEARQYLVSPRGETQWVRNVRAAQGKLVLILGRRRLERTAVEIPVAERTPVLRAYLQRWKFEVGMFFDGVGPDSTDAEFAAIAAKHPVFILG